MSPSVRVSLESLQDAVVLAEEKLEGEEWNRTIAEHITREYGTRAGYEKFIDKVFASALGEVFRGCDVVQQRNRIDVCVICDGRVCVAIECKGMVSNSHRNERRDSPLGVWGIRRKLYENKKYSVKTDITGIESKLGADAACSRFEVFVPVVYDLYRRGATDSELFEERKPWTTHPDYKHYRKTLRDDLTKWFQDNYPNEFGLIHAAESVELSDAKRMWIAQQKGHRPWAPISEAYMSFYAFARFVE